jgi:hypothetical protein
MHVVDRLLQAEATKKKLHSHLPDSCLNASNAASRRPARLVRLALSTDAIVGGRADNNFTGAAWVYTRSGGVWTQQGAKLVGTGGVLASQGWSVALCTCRFPRP